MNALIDVSEQGEIARGNDGTGASDSVEDVGLKSKDRTMVKSISATVRGDLLNARHCSRMRPT